MRGWKEVVHTNGNHKKAAVAIHILEKNRDCGKHKVGHYIISKGSI